MHSLYRGWVAKSIRYENNKFLTWARTYILYSNLRFTSFICVRTLISNLICTYVLTGPAAQSNVIEDVRWIFFVSYTEARVFIILISLLIFEDIQSLYKIQYWIIQVWSVFELLMLHIVLNIPVSRCHVEILLIFCLTMLTRTAHYILVTDGFSLILIFYFDAGYISMHAS